TDNGCVGDSVSIDIVINALPTVAMIGDSVCIDAPANITFSFTGKAPWIVDYTDGINNYVDTVQVSPYTAVLASGYTSTTTITVINVVDANGCNADNVSLPAEDVFVYPKPSTGAIFHY